MPHASIAYRNWLSKSTKAVAPFQPDDCAIVNGTRIAEVLCGNREFDQHGLTKFSKSIVILAES